MVDGLHVSPEACNMQVGETAAFDAIHALARCLPGVLGKHGLAISRALRLIELCKQGRL